MAVEAPTPQAEAVQPASSGPSWRAQAYLVGGLAGLLLGLLYDLCSILQLFGCYKEVLPSFLL